MGLEKNGVYWLTPSGMKNTKNLTSLTRDILNGGARMVQYREKVLNAEEKYHQALQLKKLCAAYRVPFIINDCIELTRAVDADGIHIGKSDSSLKLARKALGPKKIIGVSCYNNLDEAEKMVHAGADYIAFGSFHASITKPDAPICSTRTLKEAAKKFSIPIVAIGGINLGNASNLISHGATHVAIIDAISSAACPYIATKRLSGLFY